MNAQLVKNRMQIKAKLEGLKSCYQETLDAFKQKLDDITMPVFNRSDALLGSKEDLAKQASEVLLAIDECGEKLIDMNMLFCEEEYTEHDTHDSKPLVQIVERPTIEKEQTQNQESQNLPENLEVLSVDRCIFSTDSDNVDTTCRKETELLSLPPSTQQPNSEICSSSTASSNLHIPSLCPPDKSQNKQKSLNSVLEFCETNHCMEVVVCDVTSPSMFSVQVLDWMEILITLQQDLNEMYSGMRSNDIRTNFDVGMICVAMFPSDQWWYRAEIMEVLPNSKFKVFYIDYGNTAEVKRDNLRVIPKDFEEVPCLAIKCTLLGVHPKYDIGKWSSKTKVWFNKFVYGKRFEIKFHDVKFTNSKKIQSVSLFETSDNNTWWNVSTSMIYLGLATSKDKCSCCYPLEIEERVLNQKKGMEPAKQNTIKYYNTISEGSKSYTNSLSSNCNSMSVSLPAGSEKGFFKSKSLQGEQTKRSVLSSTPPQQHLSNWNPMLEDFDSTRNNYSNDIDDPCVAVENVNWQRINVCKYFLRGDCWRGKNCGYSHSRPGKMYEKLTFLFGNIPNFDLEENDLVYLKVTTIMKAPNMFYGQILCVANDQTNISLKGHCSQPKDLEVLTTDLRLWYSKNRRCLNIDDNPVCGEMFVVLLQQCYCRVTVTALGNGKQVKVFLIDYGNSLWVCKERLYQFQKAFLHLPAQALLFQNDSLLQPVTTHVYVGQVIGCEKICDGPSIVNILEEV